MSYTTDYLTKEVSTILEEMDYTDTNPTVKLVGRVLCGQNWKLAENPYSQAFLENVAYNSNVSFKLVLWLQLNYVTYVEENTCDDVPVKGIDVNT